MITQEIIKALFIYRAGALYWRTGNRRNVKQGDRAGCLTPQGYRTIRVRGKLLLEHRAVYLYHHGYLPELIDHIDQDRTNNRVDNLRPADKSINKQNSKAHGKIKLLGVTQLPTGKYMARIGKGGTRRYLGVFDRADDAAAAYNQAAAVLYP
jgi:hypothetical protein